MKAYEIIVKKAGGDVVMAESPEQALLIWIQAHGNEYFEVRE